MKLLSSFILFTLYRFKATCDANILSSAWWCFHLAMPSLHSIGNAFIASAVSSSILHPSSYLLESSHGNPHSPSMTSRLAYDFSSGFDTSMVHRGNTSLNVGHNIDDKLGEWRTAAAVSRWLLFLLNWWRHPCWLTLSTAHVSIALVDSNKPISFPLPQPYCVNHRYSVPYFLVLLTSIRMLSVNFLCASRLRHRPWTLLNTLLWVN